MNKYQLLTVSLIGTFFFVFFIAFPLRRLAFKLKIMDHPGERKIHLESVPRIGGVAIYCGILFAGLLNFQRFHILLPVFIASTIILILGIVEDKRALSARVRLFWQLIASAVIIFSGERISFLPPGVIGDWIEIIITLIWLLGVTNAYNYLDGLDGLAAGSAAINFGCFAVILLLSGQIYLSIFCMVFFFACLGFLPHNFNRKKIFLGDAGSTFLGFVLASVALVGSWAQDNIARVSIPFIILGVPIFDMTFTTIMRIAEGKVNTIIEWLKYAGRDHFHHYLVDIGLHPKGAVVFIYFITLSLGISAIMVSNDLAVEAFLSLFQAIIIFGIIATVIVVGKRRRDGWTER